MKQRILRNGIAWLLLIAMVCPILGNTIAYAAEPETVAAAPALDKNSYYLSELSYIKDQSYAGYGDIVLDANTSGEKIQLYVNGRIEEFDHGIGAHAPSCLVYDIHEYSNTHSRFMSYVGLDARKGDNGDGVTFMVSVSDDCKDWQIIAKTDVLKGNDESVLIDVSVAGKKYLKLEAGENGYKGFDHAVYADTRLMKPDYDPAEDDNVPFHTLSGYDQILAANDIETNLNNHVQEIYERELINEIGYSNMKKLYNDERYRDGIEFLRTNKKALSYLIESGPLSREKETNPYQAMVAFCEIYNKHKDKLQDTSENDFYLRLAISIACAHNYPTNARFWMEPNKELDANKRFETYIELSKPNGLMDRAGSGDGYNKWSSAEFRALSVPMMRWVVDARMNDDEFFWLADYALKARDQGEDFLDAYTYIEYKNTFKYDDPGYYSPANRNMWNAQYNFEPYFKDYGENIRRLWIVFEEGAVCGGLAKTYANLAEVFGRPSIVVGQPGHAATVTWEYSDSMGKYVWKLQNDIYGWAQSNSEYGDFMLGWGVSPYARDYRAAYTLLAFDAISDPQNYVKANQCVLLANSYKQAEQKEALYEKALTYQNINLKAWEGLTTLKLADQTLTSKDYFDFANRIMDNLAYYPKPMDDLLMAIKPKIISDRDTAEFDLQRIETLKQAEQATDANSRQPDACKSVAKFLLNQGNTEIATFSFDGEKAGKIVLSDAYKESSIRVRYSIDGGKKWLDTPDHEIQLTDDQLAQLTTENDIKVGFVGVERVHTIDLIKATAPKKNGVTANDNENIVVGNTDHLEFSLDNGSTWHDYVPGLDTTTRFEGNQQVQLRYKRFGQSISSDADSYEFTENHNTLDKTYLPLKNVTLISYSSQQNDSSEAARNLIDGNINTVWHSNYNQVDQKEYIVGFDKPRTISMLEYFPYSPNGRWKNIEVYTTMDSEVNAATKWKQVAKVSLENTEAMKTILLDCKEPARFLKIKGLDSWGNTPDEENRYFSGKMLNFYEDRTSSPVEPTAQPTQIPTAKPTTAPTVKPTDAPTAVPTAKPTQVPTVKPTAKPTDVPTTVPTVKPTDKPVENTGWVKVDGGWKYRNEDGSYVLDDWLQLDGIWYYCNADGFMLTGWQDLKTGRFYFDPWGHMSESRWEMIDGKFYYFNEWGHCAVNRWEQVDGLWYWFDQAGQMVTGWNDIDGNWYYFDIHGTMLKDWQYIETGWFYFNESGHMLTGWQWINGSWFYMNEWGQMTTNWQSIDGVWYYFNQSGQMLTGWQWIDGNCYYFYSSGAMAADTTIDGSYVNGSGIWIA